MYLPTTLLIEKNLFFFSIFRILLYDHNDDDNDEDDNRQLCILKPSILTLHDSYHHSLPPQKMSLKETGS